MVAGRGGRPLREARAARRAPPAHYPRAPRQQPDGPGRDLPRRQGAQARARPPGRGDLLKNPTRRRRVVRRRGRVRRRRGLDAVL